MKSILFTITLVFFYSLGFTQSDITFTVFDSESKETLIGVNVYSPSLDKGASTDTHGLATISDVAIGTHSFDFSYIGYMSLSLEIEISNGSNNLTIELEPSTSELDEVFIVSNRANRSVANTPSRIEVLTDEVEEAATMDPSKIAHLLMHTTGVQVQQTSATSGSASVRIQGQYGRYTQILKDGFPIYGGFTGGLGVLQIPPLDLRQVEFVKGSSSTLFGGGAIAGLINLISKEPKEKEEASLHLNLSHIGNRDLNSFYSKKSGKIGLSIFTSNNTNSVYDVDEDGFSDVPQVRKFNFNPKVFYYLNGQTTISLGGTFTNENRIGGDVDVVEGLVSNNSDLYFERNKSQQVTTQFKIDHDINDSRHLEFKNSTNRFQRNIFLNDYSFSGTQFSTFSELNYSISNVGHHLILGGNLYTDSFDEKRTVNNSNLRNQDLLTLGVFGQHIWDVNDKVAIETGFRLDYNSDYGTFPLPKVAFIFKPNLKFTARLGGGLGYKLPSIFTEDAEALAFEGILPIDKSLNKAEKSYGFNADLTYRFISDDHFSLSLTEYVFYNKLNDPLVLLGENSTGFQFVNSDGFFRTKGIESLIKASAGHFHLYLGYTYVNAVQSNNAETTSLPLTPRHSFHGDMMFVEDGKWRVGLDAEYESEQTLMTGRVVQSLFKAGFLAERMINQFAIYINLENWTDTRQTNYESLVQRPYLNPRFTEVWAPLDGFIFNAGIKVKL